MADTVKKYITAACIFSFCFKDIKNFPGVDITSAYEMNTVQFLQLPKRLVQCKHLEENKNAFRKTRIEPGIFRTSVRCANRYTTNTPKTFKTV